MTDPVLVEVLNELEARELPLLSWGVTSGAFAEDEILELLESLRPEDDPEDLLERLLTVGFLFERGIGGDQFRTRMAETVRLARHLRQWFHGPNSDWRTAKPLVSDLRFLARPRVVPVREVDENELNGRLRAALGGRWTANHETAVGAILGGRDVSEFQARSAERLLTSVGSTGGTVVTAGTGAGKTLAFYLPALAHALSVPGRQGIPRIVAIYPRIELLRDQLAGVLNMVSDLGEHQPGRLRVGVLYGATPHDRADAERNQRRGWRSTSEGLISPIVNCHSQACTGQFIWPNGETEGRLLRCGTCGYELESLVFTRRTLNSEPPEILFTTTEMVNRLLGVPRMRRLLIGDSKSAPDFILLDEIHTYSGTHGAQVANLIRRWRSEMASPSHVVGLSATLADPVGFFSQLIGAETGNVAVIAPAETEMRDSGREYFMALRGDPASQTSLLSTTIQTAMLMRRMLDSQPGVPSDGTFGTRLFAFTDKLDVVNRLHTQLQDAEGWQQGGVDRKPHGSLALLRASGVENGPRDDVGQLWDAAEALGTLTRPVIVDRTTSQDAGVGINSDVVVATASLEVGFDDPDVGAVLQHKAPRDAASFVQRRGRAGRDPTMRPWTAVVLSDYGRDRLAFQAYESLFDPVVQPSHLPIRNRVILKMQASWWLADYLTRSSGTSLRSVLGTRWSNDGDRQIRVARDTLRAAKALLTDEGLSRLERGLMWSLKISEDHARSVLFDHPRAIATTVLPTIIRRLEAVIGQGKLPSEFSWDDPFDEFVPSTLFNPLQTPEVRLLRPSRGDVQAEQQAEPIAQSMREFAPGRVSYRFALRGKRERMWVKPPASNEPNIDLETFCSDYLQLTRPPGLTEPVIQPRSIQLSRPTVNVSDSSYGRWNWEVFFRVNGEPVELDVPSGSAWRQQVRSVSVMTHRARAPLTIWRLARSVDIERQVSSEPPSTRHRLRFAGADAAVGFSMEVDGLRVDLSLPNRLPTEDGSELNRALRTTYFEHLVLTHPVLVERTPSSFLRGWLMQLALCAVVTASADVGSGLCELSDRELSGAMVHAARVVFGAEGPSDDPNVPVHEPGLIADVENALQDLEVVPALQECLATLGRPLPLHALGWFHERYTSTVAAGFIGAVQAICPDLDVETLRPDFEVLSSTDNGEPFARITISEDEPGGTGVVETAVDRIIEDPRLFWAVVSSVLGPCDGERIDETLRRFLEERQSGRLVAEVDNVRAASTLSATTAAWASLRETMFRSGIDADQTVISALATRLLRPGSTPSVEQLSRDLLDQWATLEDDLGLEIDLRVFAYLASQRDDVRQSFSAIAQADQPAEWTVGQIVGLLWSRGSKLRASSLQSYNPYSELPTTERLLVEPITEAPMVVVHHSSTDWRAELDAGLCLDGVAQVACPDEQAAADVLRRLMTAPTAVGVLEFHPRVVGVERSSTQVTLTVDIREAQQ